VKAATRIWLVVGLVVLVAIGAITVVAAVRSTPTWRIGLEAPLSGSQSSLGQGMLEGAQLAASEVNASGGLLGRDLEIVPIDDQASPDAGVAAAKAAIASHLDGIVGPYNSSVGTRTLPLYQAAGLVPVRLTSASATQGIGVTLQPMEPQIAPVAVSALKSSSSVAIAYDPTSDYTKGVAASVRDQLVAQGTKVTAFVAAPPGRTSYADVLGQLESARPQAVYAAVYYPEGALFAKGLSGSGGSTPSCLLDYASYDTGYVADAGAAAQRCLVLGVPAPADFSGAAPHVDAFRSSFGHAPGTWSPYTYDSVDLLVAAVTRNHGFATAGLTAAFGALADFHGWTGPVSISLPTGNREPATVVLNEVVAGALHEIGRAPSGPVTHEVITAQLSSVQTSLHNVGTATTYGANHLVGTSSNGIGVDMLGNVDYTAGSGRFYGSITLTLANGDVLGLEMDGSAVKHSDGSTSFDAPLKVIGGTGSLLRASGTGRFSGARAGALGSPVEATFALDLRGVPAAS
jgi:branched-chain amino acid transport system substrate-binding protein